MSKIRASHLVAIARSVVASHPDLPLEEEVDAILACTENNDEFVDAMKLAELLALPAKISGDPIANFRTFSGGDLLGFGLMGEIFLRAPTLLHALQMGEKYQFNRGDFARVKIFKGEDEVVVRYSSLICNETDFDLQLALQMSSWRFMEQALGKELRVVALSYKGNVSKDYLRKLRACFDYPIEISTGEIETSFLRRDLEQKPRFHDPVVWNNISSALATVRFRYDVDNVEKSVNRAINYHLARGRRPNVSLIANELHISKRNLQRSLREVGSSFKLELKKALIEKAELLLCSSNDSLANISNALGFSSQDSFSRFFRNNAGTTPKQFRKTCH